MTSERNPNFIQAVESEEERRKQIIEHNIIKLSSKEASDVLRAESVGGNAGGVDMGGGWRVDFSALNVEVNPSNGKIALIGNLQNIHPQMREGMTSATFRFGLFRNTNVDFTKISRDQLGLAGSLRDYVFEVLGEQTPEIKSILVESGKTYNIKVADSFQELYYAINAIGPIVSSNGQKFNPEQMVPLIEGVRNAKVRLDVLTNTYGLRDKVMELMAKG